jgi:hypothetical protein
MKFFSGKTHIWGRYLSLAGNPRVKVSSGQTPKQGTITDKGRLDTIDLLIKAACFVKKVNNYFSIKSR